MKAYNILRSIVKTVLKSDENRLRYERIASKIFSMLNLFLQAIASISNVRLERTANTEKPMLVYV